MNDFADSFAAAWQRVVPSGAADRPLYLAFSGGVDSVVLLAALRRLEPSRLLTAIHVDHGLHPDSGRWAARAEVTARRFGADFALRRVDVDAGAGHGLEAAARTARYRALAAVAGPGALLVTAHHADDQLETLLLRLLRGAGVTGLAAIRETAAIDGLRVLRPMLSFTRAEIEGEARARSLDWHEDPANRDPRFDRNYLRMSVLPAIRARWPAAAGLATRTARSMAAADAVLEDVARDDLGDAAAAGRVAVARLRGLSPVRRDNALRWLARFAGLPVPSAAQLAELAAALDVERPDAATHVAWPGGGARIHRGCLHMLVPSAIPDVPAADTGRVDAQRPWQGAAGRLELVPAAPGEPGLPDAWARGGLDVRFRSGGERLRPVGDRHTRELKKLLQQAGIVPWMRDRIPLLYRQGELIAVADLWLADAANAASSSAPRWCVVWHDRPPLTAASPPAVPRKD